MAYAWAVVERTMKVQEVMLQPMSGKQTWVQAEEIVGWSPRPLCCAGARWHILETHGLPHALYTDHAGWAFYTPKAGSPWTATRSRRSAERSIDLLTTPWSH
jgi:hypothetical protein